MVHYKGASRQHEIKPGRRRKDTRYLPQKVGDYFSSSDGVIVGIFCLPLLALLLVKIPLSGELLFLLAWVFKRKYVDMSNRAFDFPYRVPAIANLKDGSSKNGKEIGTGITLIGNDLETEEQIYVGDSDLRTHMLVLGTTGSGKTEFLLGIVFNALVQNTGFIYIDGKGDPKLQKEIFRLSRFLGREDDLLVINFITSARDFIEKQHDKVTNTMNMMGNTSSGMLIELIVSLMDDSGSSGDMWKGRAISFVAALTRPLTYLRDKGYINLSPEKYIEYFELNIIEELVWEHNGKYGDFFDTVVAPLRAYLITLPGYQKAKLKKQEPKTLDQHGFIVMQLTRIFNDLTFNYGHIFKTRVGDVDFFDVVVNRRLLVVLLPALERAPDSLRMLGKLIVGSIKQMMAGCLGNRVEGMVREIIDSRPTNSPVPFYTVLDEYGYYAVIGFAVAPAQARSLGFSIIFAAQDFSSLKKSSAEEADATWENTNIRAVGRITSGQESETWRRIQGAAGESDEAKLSGYDRYYGNLGEIIRPQSTVSIERRSRLDYDDLAMQENGEFTFLIGKKERKGQSGGVRLIRGIGFYTAGETPKEMRINDLIPVEPPEPSDMPKNRELLQLFTTDMINGSFINKIMSSVKEDPIINSIQVVMNANYKEADSTNNLSYFDACLAAIGNILSPLNTEYTVEGNVENRSSDNEDTALEIDEVLFSVAEAVLKDSNILDDSGIKNLSDDDPYKASLLIDFNDNEAFRNKALPIIQKHLFLLSDEEIDDQMNVADRKMLSDMNVISNGIPYESLEDKWDAEERISGIIDDINTATRYIEPPEPESIDLDEYKQKIHKLSLKCGELMKRKLKDDN